MRSKQAKSERLQHNVANYCSEKVIALKRLKKGVKMYAIIDRDTWKFYWKTDNHYDPPKHSFARKRMKLYNTKEEAVNEIRQNNLGRKAEPVKVHFETIIDHSARIYDGIDNY